jgi:hypothetical protein
MKPDGIGILEGKISDDKEIKRLICWHFLERPSSWTLMYQSNEID